MFKYNFDDNPQDVIVPVQLMAVHALNPKYVVLILLDVVICCLVKFDFLLLIFVL